MIKWYERLTVTYAVSIVPSEDVIRSSTCDNKWPFGLDVPWYSLQWRHNDHNGFSNHQPLGCLLNRLFRSRSKKTSKLRVTGLCVGNSPGPVNSPHNGPVTRKMFPFDDVIMKASSSTPTVNSIPPCHWIKMYNKRYVRTINIYNHNYTIERYKGPFE